MADKPKSKNSSTERELDKVEKQFKEFDENIKELTVDRMNMAPKKEEEPQLKMSQSQIEKSKDIYLKPKRSIGSKEKFNEDYRNAYNEAKEYVYFSAENHEVIGESIDFWTKPFAGMPAEEWMVPVNTPLWGPRYVAEQISRCKYHRLVMKDKVSSSSSEGQYYGSMAADSTIQRLDAIPVTKQRTVFMGGKSF